MKYRHLLAFYDYKNSLFEAMAIPGVPTSIIINTDGKVVSMIIWNHLIGTIIKSRTMAYVSCT